MWKKKKSEFQEMLQRITDRGYANLPPSFRETIEEGTRELARSGIQERVLKAGAKAPDFNLLNQKEEPRSLRGYLENGPLIVVFYRGFWCPYCNADLANLNRFLGELSEVGVSLVAISPQKPEYSRKIALTQKLKMELLSDAGNATADAFGVGYRLSQKLRTFYRDSLNANLKLWNGDDEWALPMPSRFLIDREGVVRFAESDPDYTKRPDPDQLIAAARAL